MKRHLCLIRPLLLMLVYNVATSLTTRIQVRSAPEGKKDSEVVQIYQKVMPAVMGMLSYNDTLNLILNTFLTDKKSESIWPKIIKETKIWFGDEHNRKSLTAMERDLKKYRRIILKCHRDNNGKELTKCLSVLKDEFLAGEMDFEWVQEQLVPLYLNFYSSFNLMKLASLQLLKIQQEKNRIDGIDIDKIIGEEAEGYGETLKTSVETACEQRVQRITAVQTCKVVDVLWQEYTDLCEERIKRSTEDEGNNYAAGKIETDIAARDDVEIDAKGGLSASMLGGNQNEFTEALRGKVKDLVTGQYIYNERMSVSSSMNKANVMQKIYENGLKARNKHAGEVKRACMKYWQPRGSKIAEEVRKLVNMPKKKANRKKTEK